MMAILFAVLVILQSRFIFLRVSEAAIIVAVCESLSMDISCSGSIEIIDARYGRFDTVTCVHSAMSMVGCGASGVFADIQSQCDGQTTCTLSASNSQYGDPCPQTYKYLEVTYDCRPDETTTILVTTTEAPTSPSTTTTTTTGAATPTTTTVAITTTTTAPETTTTTTTTAVETTNVETSTTSNPSTSYTPTSTSNAFVETTGSCTCLCRYLNETTCGNNEDLACVLGKLKEQLFIDKTTLSSFKRSKISAYDGRTSAKVIGFVGVVIITIFIALILIPDFVRIIRYVLCSKSSKIENEYI